MPTMAKKKTPSPEATKTPAPKSARTGVPINVWVDEEVSAAMDAYLASTDPVVSKTAAVDSALKQFLREKGFWPPKT